ncbi:TonB-dependent receptor [Wenyingzhuangia sp. 1_MG-2023]|nr:TonB-dependent receptor [Wenyingzhuangia sp. 1_MG-2023]
MYFKILSIWFFSLCSIAMAQHAPENIKGIVLNANTQQPVVGATIIGNGLFAVTSNSGTFVLTNPNKDNCVFTVSHMSYAPKTIHVDDNSEHEKIKILLNEKTNTLAEVSLYGKSEQRKVMEHPMVATLVSKTFLEKNRENSLMQTLEKIPGVSTITIGSGQSKPVIRGLGFNRVVVVQNGVKHEAQQWGNDHGLEIDQYGVEEVSIIKGPASLMYGSDAIAGVVDIKQAKTPAKNSFGGEVNLLGESNNDLLGISAGIKSRKEHWFYTGRLTYRDYGDYKVPTDKINYENYIFELHDNNLRNTAGKEADASFSLGYVKNNMATETTFSNVNAKNGFFANAHGLEVRSSSIDYDSDNRDVDLPYHKVNHFKITNNTKINLNKHTLLIDVGFQNNAREEHSEPVPHGYMPTPEDSQERTFLKNTYSLNVKDDFDINPQNHFVTGINVEHQQNNIGGWGFLIPKYQRTTLGAFAYHQLEINHNLHLMSGLRYDFGLMKTKDYYDWFQSTVTNNDGSTSQVYLQRSLDKTLDFSNFSGAIGLSYIHGKTSYKINFGKSFRMPLANELASDGVNYHMYRYERGNINLQPESSYQVDVEFNHTNQWFQFNISPFVNYFDNYIYLNPTPYYNDNLQIYEYTQAKVFRFGGEVKAETTLFKKLNLQASAEYVYSRQTSGDKKGFTLPFSPPLSGLFTASYQFKDLSIISQPRLTVDYKITATQKEIVPPEEQTEGYQVMNLSWFANLLLVKGNQPVKIKAKINNVFDTKYFNHTSFYRLIDVPEAGRNFSISLTIPI